jgi:hypothetical protein
LGLGRRKFPGQNARQQTMAGGIQFQISSGAAGSADHINDELSAAAVGSYVARDAASLGSSLGPSASLEMDWHLPDLAVSSY